MADAPLHMVRLALEQRRLFQLGRRLRLDTTSQDTGYLVHCALKDLFGDLAPKPFSLPGLEGTQPGARAFLPVLGYAQASKEQLREQAQLQASPDVHEACDWDSFASKEMPSRWVAGRRLGFTVRVCPVKRKSSAGPHHKEGAEVDVFLDACWRAGRDAHGGLVPVDRQAVYREWLAQQLAASGARLIEGKVSQFQREVLLRRDHEEKRSGARVERPDVTFDGLLEVTDPAGFGALLARGVGRHRAFGFGMLLVRPG